MSSSVINTVGAGANIDLIQNRIESLSSKMDKLIIIQEKVLNRLDGMSQDIDGIEKDMENLKVDKEEIHLPPRVVSQTQVMGQEVREICKEMSTIMSAVNQRSEQQAQKLEGVEKLVLSIQQVISFIGETVKSSRVTELIFKGPAARKGLKHREIKGKQAIKKKSSADKVNKTPDKVGETQKSVPVFTNGSVFYHPRRIPDITAASNMWTSCRVLDVVNVNILTLTLISEILLLVSTCEKDQSGQTEQLSVSLPCEWN